MDSHKLAVKFFLALPSAGADPRSVAPLPSEQVIPVLHGWIQRKALPKHLLIDVADYKHVPEGPGILLISLEANIFLDHALQPGLMYVRKRGIESAHSLADRLREVFRFALEPAALLESDAAFAGKAKFATDRFAFRIYDRLLAPNSPATFDEIKPALSGFVEEVYGQPAASIERTGPADGVFEATVKTRSAPSIAKLMDRLSPVESGKN
jgi:hypothetical protein